MARAAYLALAWPPEDASAAAAVGVLSERLSAERVWRRVCGAPGLAVWVDEDVGLDVRPLPHAAGLVLGEIWPMPGAAACAFDPNPVPPADALAMAGQLCRSHWGRYVALLPGRADGTTAVFRDASGQLECLTWSLGDGIEAVASDPPRLPGWLRPRRLALNWDRISTYVGMLSAATTAPLFDGIEAVGPGELRTLGRAEADTLVWRPADFAVEEIGDLEAAKAEIVRRVDACTAALAGRHSRLIVELSGGLDSSIVSASLGEVGLAPRVACWLNRAGDRAEGDERAYAHAVTDRLGVGLTVAAKPSAPLDEATLAELGPMFWPGINAVDAHRDLDEVARIRADSVTALVSGDGGDAVFLQAPSALIWADELRRRGLPALASPVLADVARRTRQSVWQVLGQVRAERRGVGRPVMAPSRFATREVQAAVRPAVHRWLADAQAHDVAPGKRLQINAIANCHVFRGESRRAREADLLFPLLAQPVMELCLAIGTPDLAGGAYDRPFARSAFAARLPPTVLHRRAKGNLGGYFCRLVAASLPTLRPYLMEGCLAEAGVLDREALDHALDPRQLIWGTRGNELLILAAVEAWVRYWQGRAPDSLAAPRRRFQARR